MNEERYNEFCDNTLKEIGDFINEELGYKAEFVPRGGTMPISTLAVAAPDDAEGNERDISIMVIPADVEGYKVTFLEMHMLFELEVNDENRFAVETLARRINEKFMLGNFVFYFNALCMKYGMAFDREDGVDLLDLTRSLAIFIWQSDIFGDAFRKLSRGEVSVQEAVRMATGE